MSDVHIAILCLLLVCSVVTLPAGCSVATSPDMWSALIHFVDVCSRAVELSVLAHPAWCLFFLLALPVAVMKVFSGVAGWLLAFWVLYKLLPDSLVPLGLGFAVVIPSISWLFGSFFVNVRDEKLTKPLMRWFGIPAAAAPAPAAPAAPAANPQ